MTEILLPVPSEQSECLALWKWAQHHPIAKEYLIKNTNEGKRSPQYGSSLKKIGLRPGLPDYHLPISNAKYNGLWIEMKRANHTGTKKNPKQDDWITKLNDIGHYATYAYGWHHAAEVILDYLGDKI